MYFGSIICKIFINKKKNKFFNFNYNNYFCNLKFGIFKRKCKACDTSVNFFMQAKRI